MDSINHSHSMAQHSASSAPRPQLDNPAAEVGWYLRRERERFDCSLEDAALATRINRRYLAAIEEGDLTVIPDFDDAMRYIMSYASFLGFEPAPLAQHYASVVGQQHIGSPAERALHNTMQAHKTSRFAGMGSNTMGLLVAVFMATSIFGAAAWVIVPGLSGSQHEASIPVVRADAPSEISADPMTTASIAGADEIAALVNSDGLTAEDTAALGNRTADPSDLGGLTEFIQQNVSGTVTQEPSASLIPGKQGQIFGVENDASRLVLEANAPVWVRIEDKQGNVVLTKTMMAGDAYRVPDRADLVVIARDGGALDYIVDGKKRGTLGAPGEILVGRSLEVAELDSHKKS